MRHRSRLVVAAIVLVAGSSARAEVDVHISAGGIELVDGGRVIGTLALEGPIYDVARAGNVVYVARGPAGVTAVDIAHPEAPRELATFTVGRPAVKLAIAGAQLIVVAAAYEALAFDLADPVHPRAGVLGAPAPPAGPAAAPAVPAAPVRPAAEPAGARARVVAVRGGWAAIEADRPLTVGERFELRAQDEMRVVDPTTGRERRIPSNEVRGVFQLAEADGPRGSGPLPRGVIAMAGDLAAPTTQAAVEKLTAPPLWRDMTRVVVIARPFLSIDHLGFGMISSLIAEHFFAVPLRLGVELSPLSFLIQSSHHEAQTLLSGGLGAISQPRLTGGYSTDFFEVGLGLGGEVEHQGPTSLSIAPSIRIGALDGLRLSVTNGYTLIEQASGTGHQFAFASLVGELAIPLTRHVTLVLAGGGASEWAYSTAGIATYLRGTGGPGTWIFHASIGGAWVNDRTHFCGVTCTQTFVDGAGPTVGAGVEARL